MKAMLPGLPSDFSGNFEKPLIAVPCLRWERHPSSAGKHRVWLEVSVWVAQSCLGFPSAEQLCQLSFQITDSNLAFISNLSIISPHKKGEVNKDTSDREKTLDINLFIFPAGSAAVFSEQHWIRARRLVEPQAPEGCCTGRLEQHKEASNSPSGKSPHRSTGNGNAICLLLSRSPLLGAGKKLAHGGGLSVPCCMEVGCRLLGGTCRDQPALLSFFSLFSGFLFSKFQFSLFALWYHSPIYSQQTRNNGFLLPLLPRFHSFFVPYPVSHLLPPRRVCYQLTEYLFK